LNESDYCCFAVRDGQGELQALFNRKIKGPAGERFLLGEQHVYCWDWSEVDQAAEITICEAIIDALSVRTLSGGCVLAIPGANYDLRKMPDLPTDACLIEAFDGDDAGRAAAERLRKRFPQHQIKPFDLQGAHDVNALLCSGETATPRRGQLSVGERVEIVMSDVSSRQAGVQYGVHHSRVCDIRKDAAETLKDAWARRKPGRKTKQGPSGEVEVLKREKEEMTSEMELLQMRNDWLALQLKMAKDRLKSAGCDKEKKSRRRRNC
jgi:hypothetical protein